MTPASEGSVDWVIILHELFLGLSPGSDHLTELVDETDNGWTRDKVCFILSINTKLIIKENK